MNANANKSNPLERFIKAQNGDLRVREQLVQENIALVKHLVKRFLNRGMDYDDLFQTGCLGLMKAIDRFDPGYAVQFSTYAVPVILGEIRRCLRDDGLIHVSRTIQEQARRVEAYRSASEAQEGRCPSISEIANALEMEASDVLLAVNSRNRLRSLSEPVSGESDTRLMDVVGCECMNAVDQRLTLSQLLEDLNAEERALILRRYFKSHTQTQIARDMGISQVQVSRMESRIIKRMRAMAGTETAQE